MIGARSLVKNYRSIVVGNYDIDVILHCFFILREVKQRRDLKTSERGKVQHEEDGENYKMEIRI